MKILCKLGIVLVLSACTAGDPKSNFWDNQKRGANTFAVELTEDTLVAARTYGVQFLRLAADKWPSDSRDFLLGNADDYTGLVQKDLAVLKTKLAYFEKYQIPVVITMLSLPGSRWRQNNNNKDDLRLWEDESFEKQAAQFWQDLVRELLPFKSIVGYNILNEPHLDRLVHGDISQEISLEQKQAIQNKLHSFYTHVIDAIRQVDKKRFIVLDASWYGDARTMPLMRPVEDARVIYSFHMYEPYAFTNYQQNQGKYAYPKDVLHREGVDAKEYLNKFTQSVKEFQRAHHIANNRIMAGEFGVNRRAPGAQQYLEDLIQIFNENQWHWAIYAFRDLDWDGMDYELGTEKLPWQAWEQEPVNLSDFYTKNALFEVIKKGWQGTSFASP